MRTLELKRLNLNSVLIIVIIAIIGLVLLQIIQAAGPKVAVQPTANQIRGGGSFETGDATAANRDFVQFGNGGGNNELAYQQNLQKIRAQPWRNTNEDDSPYRGLTMQQLDADAFNQLNNDKRDYIDTEGRPEYLDYFKEQWGTNDRFPPGPDDDKMAFFRTGCEFSHFAYDDPLVYPNQPEASHLHMFFGNTDVNAYTTYDKLFNTGGGTCNGNEMNRTGYWAPAVFDGRGNVRIPDFLNIYYKNESLSLPGFRHPWALNRPAVAWPVSADYDWIKDSYPDPGPRIPGFNGVALIADHKDRTYNPPGPRYFECIYENGNNNIGGVSNGSIEDLNCPDQEDFNQGKSYLEINVFFPQCWNEQDPWPWNSGNVGYGIDDDYYWRNCPATGYTQYFTGIIYRMRYEVEPGDRTSEWFLSADVDAQSRIRNVAGGQTTHADWWGAWNPTVVELWHENCQNVPNTSCGYGYMDGQPYDVRNQGDTLRYRDKYTGPNKVPVQEVFNRLCSQSFQITRDEQAAWCNPG